MEILLQCLNWVTTSISVRLSKWVIGQLLYFRRAQAAVTNILNYEINAASALVDAFGLDKPGLLTTSDIALTDVLYLDAFIAEILGVNIPAGTPVLLVTDQFVPERWMRSDGTFNAIAGPSLPFSTGARGCFGRKIALLEMKFMISMLLLSFEFPELESRLSTYGSTDAQIRRPTHEAAIFDKNFGRGFCLLLY
ncbi:cytochrome P450 [Colletotrichum lupini]|uniref:Cytochrome P450 n=1 Tax=Colletotrichum lupini TaxID=145971 RepID=A0A9Q8SEZ6_9PEZI|nr:cytochrome P450 [Colletotrichum lupini]UQC76159.1 cytochrome P450 [Colletotrichum lupini]